MSRNRKDDCGCRESVRKVSVTVDGIQAVGFRRVIPKRHACLQAEAGVAVYGNGGHKPAGCTYMAMDVGKGRIDLCLKTDRKTRQVTGFVLSAVGKDGQDVIFEGLRHCYITLKALRNVKAKVNKNKK